jgi:DNA repair exonuclease SbcCD ATPase subunit
MKKIALYTLAFCLVYMSACRTEKDEIAALHQEIMRIHDEIMPEMRTIGKLKTKISEEIIAIEQENKEEAGKLRAIREELDEAANAMRVWMKEYQKPTETMKYEEALQYLQQERERMLEVKQKMEKSIEQAKLALGEKEPV